MSIESHIISALKEVPYSTNSLHFVRSSNPTAMIAEFEDFAQTDFGPRPKEIELNDRNLLALALNSLFNRHLKQELSGAIEPNVAGQYLPTYHALIYKPHLEGTKSTRTHELAHAFARNRNPFAMRLVQSRFGHLTSLFQKFPAAVDLVAANKVIQEGFATWAAAEITGIPTHFHPVETTRMSFDHLKIEVEYQKSIRGSKATAGREAKPGAFHAPYVYGGRFVGATIRLLKEAGCSQSEAINAFLEKCPQSLEQLYDPREYAHDILFNTDPEEIETMRMMETAAKILLTA